MSYGGTKSSDMGAVGHETSRAASPPRSTGEVPAGPAESESESDAVANSESNASAEHEQEQEVKTTRQKLMAFYDRNFGLFLIFLAEIFASLVSQPPPLKGLRASPRLHSPGKTPFPRVT